MFDNRLSHFASEQFAVDLMAMRVLLSAMLGFDDGFW
jgi:hypothetical protein